MLSEELTKNWFLSAINNHKEASTELKRALVKNKIMVDRYIKILHKELLKCEQSGYKTQNKKFKPETFKWFVEEMANDFVKAKEKAANESIQSEFKRLSVVSEKQKEKEHFQTFNGQVDGELKEYVDDGVLILDEAQLQRPNSTIKTRG